MKKKKELTTQQKINSLEPGILRSKLSRILDSIDFIASISTHTIHTDEIQDCLRTIEQHTDGIRKYLK